VATPERRPCPRSAAFAVTLDRVAQRLGGADVRHRRRDQLLAVAREYQFLFGQRGVVFVMHGSASPA
jgi:hypothetical protein